MTGADRVVGAPVVMNTVTVMDVSGVFTPESCTRTPKIDKGDDSVRRKIKGVRQKLNFHIGFRPLCNSFPFMFDQEGLAQVQHPVGLAILIFHLSATPFQRGFFCNDDSIKYPYHDSTITSLQLYFIGALINILCMIIFEGYIYKCSNLHLQLSANSITCSRKILPLLFQLYKVIVVFALTCCTSQTLTDIGKYTIGRLRPHFLDVCKPDLQSVNCSTYVVHFDCHGTDSHRIRDSRLSFPSGHSSFSAVTMVYFMLYVQARFPWQRFLILRAFLQVAAFAIAFYVALSRISDYKHHPTDVLAGSILGSVVAITMVFSLSGLFQMPKLGRQTDSKDKNDVSTGHETIPI
ncbi:putative phosphatidate phosphatase [Nymphon striatum]|nr:putative phosphatidate phosphatase [Nymphon striatum]